MKNVAAGILLGLFFAFPVHAQTILQDEVELWRAQVVEVISNGDRLVEGTDISTVHQTLKIKLLEGARAGDVINLENDYIMLDKGDVFYLRHAVDAVTRVETYTVSAPYRLPALMWLGGLFLVCLVLFGGKQGARGFAALVASMFFIGYLLFPGMLAGYSPVLVALGVASLIIVAGSYITHGFYRATHAAVLGMLVTIFLTGILAYASIHGAKLSGYNEEAVYLNFSTHGNLDFVGLLLGGLLIGLLGVLYDAAISQAIAVEELASVGKHLTKRELFSRGLRIGREHIGALVNTLAIAYVGVSLPLLLYFMSMPNQNLIVTLNQELFSTEIVRMLVGSIGVILAVPITTIIAVYLLHGRASVHSDRQSHSHSHVH